MPVDRTTAYGPTLDLDIADRLLEIYTNTERQLAADIARRLRAGMDAPDWAERKLAEAGALRRATLALLSRLAVDDGTVAQALVLAYMRGGHAAAAELLRLGQPPPASGAEEALQGVLDATVAGAQRALASAVRAFPGLGALQRMVFSLASRLAGTHLPVLRWAIDSYRDVVAEGALAPVLLGTATRRAGTQRAWEQLLTRGVTGFTDVAGRRWNLASYVEMATRTGVAQAAVEGHLDRLGDAGIDLVIVSNAPQECIRCRPWEGKVLARGGKPGPRTVQVQSAISDDLVTVEVAGTVAEAIAAGLMHPNCRHSLSAYLPGVTRIPTNTEDPEGDAARQHLRKLERNVRKARLQEAGALTPEAKKAAGAKVRAGQAAIREHVAATRDLGIMRKPERERIDLGHTTAADAGRRERKPAAPKAARPRYTGPQYRHPEGTTDQDLAQLRGVMERKRSLSGPFARLSDSDQALYDTYRRHQPVMLERIGQEVDIDQNFAAFKAREAPGKTDAELQQDLARRAKRDFAGHPVAMRLDPDGLLNVLTEGRVKTQFETGSSHGGFDPELRAQREQQFFGIDLDADPTIRPVYGYLHIGGDRPTGRDGIDAYGEVQVIFRQEVRDRTTAMVGDSLDQADKGRPSPVSDPEWRSFTPADQDIDSEMLERLERDYASDEFREALYVEAQIHGGVRVEDIAEIILARPPDAPLLEALKARGVPWRVLLPIEE